MKKMPTFRPRRNSRRPILYTLRIVAAAAGLSTWTAPLLCVAQSDADHPRYPSTVQLSPVLTYGQGLPTAQSPVGADTASLYAQGRELYAVHCASCHGADLTGTRGMPSIAESGGAGVDFFVATGRMPGAAPDVESMHEASHFDARQIAAIDAYVTARATAVTPIPQVTIDPRLLRRGRKLFENNCEACHGAAAQGATVGGNWIAVALDRATPTEIGEAVRIGPGTMPRFSTAQLTKSDVDAVATYVRYLSVTPGDYGGSTLEYLGPMAEGLVAGAVGVGSLFFVMYFTGTRADGTRLSSSRKSGR